MAVEVLPIIVGIPRGRRDELGDLVTFLGGRQAVLRAVDRFDPHD